MGKLNKKEIEDFNLSQVNPLFHGLTCMGFNGCQRNEQENDGLLIATEDGISCPCGNYKQDYPTSLSPTYEDSIKELPEEIKDIIEDQLEDDYSPYCPECTACGESGCCSPLGCNYTETGQYCEWYLKELKYNYEAHLGLMEIIYENESKYSELIGKLDELEDKLNEKYYPKE